MATQEFASKLFIFSKTAHTGLSATFNRKKVNRLGVTHGQKNMNEHDARDFGNFLNRFEYDGSEFCYAYFVENSTEQERLMMKLRSNTSDYIGFISCEQDTDHLRICSDLLGILTDNFDAVSEMENMSLGYFEEVGLSKKKMGIRWKLLLDEISNNIGLTLEKFDAKFRI